MRHSMKTPSTECFAGAGRLDGSHTVGRGWSELDIEPIQAELLEQVLVQNGRPSFWQHLIYARIVFAAVSREILLVLIIMS